MQYTGTLVCFIALFLIILSQKRRQRRLAALVHRVHKKNIEKNGLKENKKMKELAEKFVGKECIVYTILGSEGVIKGLITEVTDEGLLIDYKGNLQAVNLEYVTRIREWPRNAKGKKKSIFE